MPVPPTPTFSLTKSALGAALLLAAAACSQNGATPASTVAEQPAQTGNGTLASSSNAPVQTPAVTATPNATAPATVANTVPVLTPVCSPAAAADVQVTVTSKAGPKGYSAPRPLSNKMWSMNLDLLQPGDYSPTLNANFVTYLKALNPAMLRWPDGVNGQYAKFTTTGTGTYALTPALIDSYVALCRAVGAEPYIGINMVSGTSQDAVNLMTYMNVTRGYKVKYVHLGNEPDNGDGTFTAQSYGSQFLAYKQALQAVDANLKFTGAELMTGGSIMAISPYTDFLTPVLQATQSSPMDAMGWHYYPKNSSETNASSSANASVTNLLLEDATDWPPAGMDFASSVMPKIKTALATYAPKAEIWIDEIAEDSGKANGIGTGDTAAGALWQADEIGRYAEQGADAAFRFIFKTGLDANGLDHGYTMVDANNQPRPGYSTYWLYAQQFGDQLVLSTTDTISQVQVHAATRTADGTLRVMLINKTSAAKAVHLTLTDFVPSASARYLLQGSALSATTMTLNGSQLTAQNLAAQGANAVAAVATTDGCQDNVVKLPAVSVTLLVFAPAATK